MPFFIRIEPEEEGGEPTYQEVDPKQIELPEDHPLVVTAEQRKKDAAKYRRLFQQEKAQVEALKKVQETDDAGDDAEQETTETVDPATPATLDVDSLYAEFVSRFTDQMNTQQTEAQQREARIKATLTEYKLPEKLRTVLEPVAGDEAKLKEVAATIKNSSLVFEDTPAGSMGDSTSAFEKAMQKLGIADD